MIFHITLWRKKILLGEKGRADILSLFLSLFLSLSLSLSKHHLSTFFTFVDFGCITEIYGLDL